MPLTSLREKTFPVDRVVQSAFHAQRELLNNLVTREETQLVQIYDEKKQAHLVEIPTNALCLLVDILGELAQGNSVNLLSRKAELTTQEAAKLLNVSRPHVVKLISEGALQFHMVGTHRRILLSDLKAFMVRHKGAGPIE
jgi:excisionase family DNA binding protein